MNNTVVRTLSGIVFIGIMVVAILFGPCTFFALATFIIVAGMLEFYQMTIPRGVGRVQKVLGIATGISLSLALFFLNLYAFVELIGIGIVLFIALLTATFISTLYAKLEKPFEVLSYTVIGILYIALPFSVMNFWMLRVDGELLLIAYFIILWTNDVGAYCFGMTVGRICNHKLFPRHSPKKTWEGFIGGVLLAMLAGYLIDLLMFDGTEPLRWIGLGFLVAILATFGDLLESMLKRSAGVKDSGNIMPGHGGILDRFDGVLLSIIPATVYLVTANL